MSMEVSGLIQTMICTQCQQHFVPERYKKAREYYQGVKMLEQMDKPIPRPPVPQGNWWLCPDCLQELADRAERRLRQPEERSDKTA